MKSLAVIVSGGNSNQFLQALTLLMAAVHSGVKVRVLFRDEAVFRLRPSQISVPEFSEAYNKDKAGLERRLKQHDLNDLHKLFRDIKASGDVRYFACSSSLAIGGISREELVPEIDEVRSMAAFLMEEVASADKVLTF